MNRPHLGKFQSLLNCPQVDRMASLYNIHLRTGCFCNTGACQSFLGISNQQMRRNLQVRSRKRKKCQSQLRARTGRIKHGLFFPLFFPRPATSAETASTWWMAGRLDRSACPLATCRRLKTVESSSTLLPSASRRSQSLWTE